MAKVEVYVPFPFAILKILPFLIRYISYGLFYIIASNTMKQFMPIIPSCVMVNKMLKSIFHLKNIKATVNIEIFVYLVVQIHFTMFLTITLLYLLVILHCLFTHFFSKLKVPVLKDIF